MSDRIRGHMNADHQLALKDYLVVYGNLSLSEFDESSVLITDVTEKSITIGYVSTKTSNPESFTINWDDASEKENVTVSGFGDIKNKLIAMANFAAEKQGYSSKQIKKALGPSKFGEYVMYAAFLYLLANVYDKNLVRSVFAKDALFSGYIAPYVPALVAKVSGLIQDHAGLILSITESIHILEILLVTVPNIKKYRVPLVPSLQWIFMHFIEGFFVIKRWKTLTN
ncbi:predicted protein [Scheffersomyces stipitis CBS 6054]|uniref:DUF2470 domain-containing protein n=1 Tax=Scheffersomyces stipitis (strain ATCC 58785 / CBS 6054 / NBRC 10063 / NRRL Y-11545) TaxID=322104 RepID=A3LY12_PICST|nr:predicted protein [Scheffersomyces stipitis CBS 6054]ABN67555.2 predicted protein [Scheffersomyces stipitis CBS 6054]KAG2732080.1 hypothetical protein G9P44_004497 [Scheffersomyces stipitis]